jgi:putative ABC transport system permease protein
VIGDFRYAVRILRKSPGFALLVVLLLALGIGANTAMFSILDAWLLEPLHFPAADRLAIILKSEAANPSEPKIFVNYRDWEEYQRQSRSFASVAAVFWRSGEADDANNAPFGMIVTANLFGTLGVKPARGRIFAADDINGPPVVVIAHDYWKARFGGASDIAGRTMKLGSKVYQIIGVMPSGFGLRMINQGIDPQFYALIQKDEPAYSTGGGGPVAAIGRMKPGVGIETAQAELARIQHSLDERRSDNPKGYTVLITNLQKDNTRNVRASILLSAAALGFVLVIVCSNVGSLLLGRTLQRRREMAVRAALGSGTRRIVRQLMTESALITILGAGAGILAAEAGLRIFGALNPFGRAPQNAIALDWRALAFTLLVSIGSTILFGLAPALQAAAADLNEVMKSSARNVTPGVVAFRLRGLMVAGQVALAMVLVVGAVLMTETLARLQSQSLGFGSEGRVVARVAIPKERWNDAAARHRIYQELLHKLRSTAGVQDAAISNAGPLDGGFEDHFSIEGRATGREENEPKASTQSITPDYFATLGVPMIAGRMFTDLDTEISDPVVVINESAAARWFRGRNPIGEHIKLRDDKDWRRVAGIVGDTSYTFYNTLEWLRGPKIFLPSTQAGADKVSPVARVFYTVIRGRGVNADGLRGTLKSTEPSLHLDTLQTLPEMIAEVVEQPRLRTKVLAAIAVFSLLLAAIGVYAVMAQSVALRTPEIGLRMALGAETRDLVRMVVGQGVRMAAVGIAVGTASALAMTRWIASLLYGVKPTDLVTFVAAAGVLLIAVVLAALIPAWGAARIDPLEALREE